MNIQRKFTPEQITELKENEVFVFGSNLNGNHAGGAARVAVEKFGAIDGQAVGLQGNSYAVPTLDEKMEKLSLEDISKSIDELYSFADENPHLDFWVTKIGCGIAGFTEKEIGDIFKSKEFQPFNVFLPMEFSIIKGVKGFDKNMTCRGMKFENDKEFHQDGDIQICDNGIHYCENPLEVFRFYLPSKSIYSEVEGFGCFDTDLDDSKVAVSDLKVKAKIELPALIKFGVDFTLRKVSFLTKKANKKAEDSTAVANSFSSTAVANSYRSTAVANFKNSIAIANKNSKAKGKIGAAIVCVETYNEDIIAIKAAIIDGVTLKEDTFYQLVNGEFTEAE